MHVFEDNGVLTPCHSDLEGTKGVNVSLGYSIG